MRTDLNRVGIYPILTGVLTSRPKIRLLLAFRLRFMEQPRREDMNTIKVLIAEDHTILREGLLRVFELNPDIHIVGEAKDGRQAVSMALDLHPDVVLMDIAMPSLNGLEATRQLVKQKPGIRILILTAHNDDAYVQSAMEAGASGFLLKQTSANDVCWAIRELHKGKLLFSPSIARRLTRIDPKGSGKSTAINKKMGLLTSREMEVLQLIAEGNANKETAAALNISIKTVEKHRGRLMEKLDIHDTASLTRYAIAAGIIESSVQVTIL